MIHLVECSSVVIFGVTAANSNCVFSFNLIYVSAHDDAEVDTKIKLPFNC